MEVTPDKPESTPMPLAENLRKFREENKLSLDDVATKAGISKTYLWELERDTEGAKKPSAAVLMRVANALSRTLAELLALPTVRAPQGQIELPQSLQAFRDRLAREGQQLSDADLSDLASMRFRGVQPQTTDEWHQLYLVMMNTVRRKPE